MSEERAGLLDGAIAPVSNPHLFGHEAAEAFLARNYRSGKGHHAILIEGPEGIGKATLAFRFANHILRHPDPTGAPEVISDPVPEHPVTRQLASGASHNLLHLSRPVDEKSGRVKTAITVDEVRKLRDFFGLSAVTRPLLGGYFVDRITGWWAFSVDIPVGVAAFPIARLTPALPRQRDRGYQTALDKRRQTPR